MFFKYSILIWMNLFVYIVSKCVWGAWLPCATLSHPSWVRAGFTFQMIHWKIAMRPILSWKRTWVGIGIFIDWLNFINNLMTRGKIIPEWGGCLPYIFFLRRFVCILLALNKALDQFAIFCDVRGRFCGMRAWFSYCNAVFFFFFNDSGLIKRKTVDREKNQKKREKKNKALPIGV